MSGEKAKSQLIISTLKSVADYLDEIKQKSSDQNKTTWEDAVRSIRELSKMF